MKANKNKTTQLERISSALVSLAADVTTTDRREAPVSEVTVWSYLKGDGKDLDTAIQLLKYFRKRIADREKILKAS